MDKKRPTNERSESRTSTTRPDSKKTPEATEDSRPRERTRSMGEWNDLISQRIEEAARDGVFDNLRGSGKPQNLDRNPYAPEGMEMAFDLLQNNDLAPGWVMERKEIQGSVAALRKLIESKTTAHREAQDAAKDRARLNEIWRRKVLAWQIEIAELNRRIDTLNLDQPLTQLELIKLRLDDELGRVGATQTEA